MRRYLAGGLAMLFPVTACSSRQKAAPAPPSIEAWRSASITPIGQPVAAGDVVVVYGTVDQDLYLFGVAVADGAVRWRQAASPGLVANGIPLEPAVVDHRVVYFRPDPVGELAARLVVASPDTGEDVFVSAPAFFLSHPGHCPDGADICVMVRQGDTSMPRRFSVDAGGQVPDHDGPPAGSRFLGHDLLDLSGRNPETLAGFSAGKVRWTAELSRFFSPGHSSDYGWHFEFYRSNGVDVGTVGHDADARDANATIVDLGKAQTVGFDAASGWPAWQVDATDFTCDDKVALERKMGDNLSETWPVRCRYRGTARYDAATGAATYAGLDVRVEGFDVATGKVTWSVPLGSAQRFMADDTGTTKVGDTEVLAQAATGPVIIDVAHGSTRRPAKGEVFWCGRNELFRYRERRHHADGATTDTWRGGTLLQPCAADGTDAAATPRRLPQALGATVGHRTVVAEAGALVSYEQGAG